MKTMKLDRLHRFHSFIDSSLHGRKPLSIGCTPKGRTATQRSEKGSEKVLGRVLGKGFSEGF